MTNVQDLKKRINASQDWLGILTALLTACRLHETELSAALRNQNSRADAAGQRKAVANALVGLSTNRTTSFVDKPIRKFICGFIDGHAFPLSARVMALAIDLHVRSTNESSFSTSCSALSTRELVDLSPYPTPRFPLNDTFGKRGFSMHRSAGSSDLEVDRVPGLSLWRSSVSGAIRVIYDPVMGAQLDAALEPAFSALAVCPNQSFHGEFSPGTQNESGFFGINVEDSQRQKMVFEESVEYCKNNQVEILALPELSSTEGVEEAARKAMNISWRQAGEAPSRPFPSVVVAGSRHMTIDGKKVNRQTIWYRGVNVHHDKVGRFVMGAKEKHEDGRIVYNDSGEEAIDRGDSIRIHAGISWSMIPLICADFLEEGVVNAVKAVRPRLVVVSSMSQKTADFENTAAGVIAAAQSTVIVANGPVEWNRGNEDASTRASDFAKVALFILPLGDPASRTIRVHPAEGTNAPHRTRFRSSTCSAEPV